MEEDEKDIRSAIENPKYKPQRVAPRKGKIILSFIEPLSITVYSTELDPESSLINLSIENKHPVNDLYLLSVNLSMNTTVRDFDGDSARLGTKGLYIIFLTATLHADIRFIFFMFLLLICVISIVVVLNVIVDMMLFIITLLTIITGHSHHNHHLL